MQWVVDSTQYRKLSIALFFTGLALYAVTAFSNIGMIALDDFEFGVAWVLPAQTQTDAAIIQKAGIHSPLPSLILANLARLGLRLGMTAPANQLRFTLVILGLFSFAASAGFGVRMMRLSEDRAAKEPIFLFLISFFFLCPLLFTRPMIESLSAPFLMISAFFACDYFAKERVNSLLFAVAGITFASLLRLQSGSCFLGLIVTVLLVKKWRDMGLFLLFSLACFFLSGLIDYKLKGAFHSSLFSYVKYNLGYSSTYGTSPFYTFALLFLGLTLPPAFFIKYRGFPWKQAYRPLLPAILYFVSFLIAHSIVPHKEERFMIPVIPLFLVLLTPLADYLLQRGIRQWRILYFLTLNLFLLIFASFNVPQNNIIGLALFIHEHPQFQRLTSVADSLVIFPKEFVLHPLVQDNISLAQVSEKRSVDCHQVIAIRTDIKKNAPILEAELEKIAEFKPGLLEGILVKLNPRQNGRRASIELFANRSCRL